MEISAMTVKDLRSFARDRSINLKGATVKADIVAAIHAALNGAAAAAANPAPAPAPARANPAADPGPASPSAARGRATSTVAPAAVRGRATAGASAAAPAPAAGHPPAARGRATASGGSSAARRGAEATADADNEEEEEEEEEKGHAKATTRRGRVYVVAAAAAATPAVRTPVATVDGMGMNAMRTQLMKLVRDMTLSRQSERVERMLVRQARRDYFTEAPLDGAVPAARVVHEVEHTVECQMMGHAIAYTPAMRDVLRNVDHTTPTLSRQPVVVRNRLEAVKRVQNGDANLTLVTHDTNVKKGGAIRRYLSEVDHGTAPGTGGLEAFLYGNFVRDYDDTAASRYARGVVHAIRTVEPLLVAGLGDPDLESILRSQGVQERGAVQRQLADIADELSQLCDRMTTAL